ncbi:MAG: PAS domain S-box protein [Deltaproteobacteria bacterium]
MKFIDLKCWSPKTQGIVITLAIFLIFIWTSYFFARLMPITEIFLSIVACGLTWWFIKVRQSKALLEQRVVDREEELVISEFRFRSFVENSNDLIYTLSPTGIITYVAPNVEMLLGFLPSELIGTSFEPLIHPDELPACLTFLQEIVKTGEKLSGLEYRIRHKNGTWHWYMSNASLINDSISGNPVFFGIGRNIDYRKQALDTLHKSEQFYHSMVETSQDLIWQCDTEGVYTYQNLAWEYVLGYELHEMLGKKYSYFQTPEDSERFQKEFEHLMEGETFEELETTFIGKSGNRVHLVFNALFLVNDKGEIIGAGGTAYDISKRKQMENALRESEEKHRIILEESADAIFSISPEGRYSYVNKAFSRNVDKAVEDIIGKTLWDVFPKDEADKRFSSLNKAFRTGIAEVIEVCIPVADDDRYFMTTISPIMDGKGEPLIAICIAKNITKLKTTEKTLLEMKNKLEIQSEELQSFNELLEQRINERTLELVENKARIDKLCEQSCTMIWEVDAQGLYTYVNHVSESLFGYRPEDMVGLMHWYDVFPESEQEQIKNLVAPIIINKLQIHNLENRTTTKDGREIWWVTNGLPILGYDGSLLGYRGSDTDITESRKLKEQLQRSQKIESIGQLAGGLAHDFNNILSIINGYCFLLKTEMEQNAQMSEYVEKIHEASKRGGELTHCMLAYSRSLTLNPENHNLNMIVTNIGSFVKRIIGEDIHFSITTNEVSLPVYVDIGQIEQLLINLVTNARDAMPKGGDLSITTDFKYIDDHFISANGFGEQGSYALITVSDTGKGMDQATLEKIFEPFFTTKEVGKGTGLGLAMVYGIASQHNGFVDVTSVPDHGTSFLVYLPIVESEYSGTKIEDSVEEIAAGSETILVVEDEPELRKFMGKLLLKIGYRVIFAVDGQDAVDKFRENSDAIDLIIMDMIMPNKSGKAAYDEIRQIRPDAKALFSSGYSAKIVQEQGELGEHAEFMSKPVQSAKLLKKVREMLEH